MHKKIEKSLCLILATLLLLSMAMVVPTSASPTAMSVVPSSIVDTDLGPTKTFSVDVVALNVVDLYSFEFKLWYDTSVLTATGITPGADFPAPPKTYVSKKVINDTIGLVWVAITRLAPLVGIPGPADVPLATIDFKVDDLGDSALDLQDTILAAYALPWPLPITHYVDDGYFNNVTAISVVPSSILDTNLGPTKTFSVDVVALDVTDLYSFEFKLYYDTSVLTATSITPGADFPAPPKTYVSKKVINDTIGLVWVAITRLAPLTGVSGDILLAKIDFKVDDCGESALDLKETALAAYALPWPLPILHDVVDGYFINVAMSVVPSSIVDTTLGPGSTFSVDVVALDVIDLYSFEFKLWYKTSVLTATSITSGADFPAPPKTYVAKKIINDTIGLVWVGITRLSPLVGIPGPADVVLAKINFTVDAWGYSVLDLEETVLCEYALPWPLPIPYAVVDGYFLNEHQLVRRSAWPEYRHFVIDTHGTKQTLYAIVQNPFDYATTVWVTFTISTAPGIPVALVKTDPKVLQPGEMYGHEKTARYSTTWTVERGKWYVTAQVWWDRDGDGVPDTPGDTKDFSFRVV